MVHLSFANQWLAREIKAAPLFSLYDTPEKARPRHNLLEKTTGELHFGLGENLGQVHS